MKVKHIELKNFRNYPDLILPVTNDMVVFSGPNAVGKTNLLESVYFASLFKSFRDDADFIFMKGTESAQVKVIIEQYEEEHVIEVFLEKREKIYANFKIDGVKKKRRDAQGYLKVVVFDPSDVEMFSKSPDSRRKYLNMVLSQKSLEYLDALAQYKKILLFRNKLLLDIKQGRTEGKELESWNEQLITTGAFITFERRRFMDYVNQSISEVYSAISGFHRPVEVMYEATLGDTEQDIAINLRNSLPEVFQKEVALASSLIGPHRDDFYLTSEGLYLSPFSSRGELRSQVLALKILELESLSTGADKPVLLLDDVLSELDDVRRTYLLKYLQGKFQTFITTTHPLEMAAQHVTLTPSIQEEV
jgi:DNA replication and repair protein RecF